MKPVTKLILCACIIVYVAGLWKVIIEFGLDDLLAAYGIAALYGRLPEANVDLTGFYVAWAIYTVLFGLLTYFVCRYSNRAVKEQEDLQAEASVVTSYADRMSSLLARYDHSEIKDTAVRQKLQTLARQIASLPPAVARNAAAKSQIANIVTNLQDLLDDHCTLEAFSSAVDVARDDVNSLKRQTTVIN